MEQELISKKDLLDLTGLSYGALYRYKRKGLIPDDWFIRKATFTGQETFFPKAQILERMEQIRNLKEDISLDEMADVLSGQPTHLSIRRDALLPKISPPLQAIVTALGDTEQLQFDALLAIYTAHVALDSGILAVSECAELLQVLLSHQPLDVTSRIVAFRKSGVFFCELVSGTVLGVSEGTALLLNLPLEQRVSQLKTWIKEQS